MASKVQMLSRQPFRDFVPGPVIDCFCIWSDLLGFGRSFELGGWSLSSDEVQRTAKRVSAIEHLLFRSNSPLEEFVLILNDGLARNYDCPHVKPGYMTSAFWWLHSVLSNHWHTNAIEKQDGNPGMRSVLCAGQRMDLREPRRSAITQMLVAEERKEEFSDRTIVYSPLQFQMNLAFSKAYLIESLGSKGGLAGPGLFVEEDVLSGLLEICAGEHIPGSSNLLYKNSFTQSHDFQVFSIRRDVINSPEFRLEIKFDTSPVEIRPRGITTKMWRVIRYHPPDEDESFWFDFGRPVSTSKCKELRVVFHEVEVWQKQFCGAFPAQRFSWSCVEQPGEFVEFFLRMDAEVFAFG
jgi:hypothetical protein